MFKQALDTRLKRYTVALFAMSQVLCACAQQSPEPVTEAALHKLIRTEVGDASCDADAQCKTLGVGEKDCGGPEYWLAWSSRVSQPEKLQSWSVDMALLQRHRNEASGARSNCRYIPDPGAICVAKRCILNLPDRSN